MTESEEELKSLVMKIKEEIDGRESEWSPGVGDGQGGLACCNSQGRKELDTTERLNWTELNWKAGLKLNIQKTKIMASGTITSWQIDGETMETVKDFFLASKITADGDWSSDVCSSDLHFHFSLSCIGEGNGSPLQCSCLENLRDGGAWWAAIYGVAQCRHDWSDLGAAASPSKSSSFFFLVRLLWKIHLTSLGEFVCSKKWGIGYLSSMILPKWKTS